MDYDVHGIVPGEIVGKVAIRWVRRADGGTEFQVVAEGLPETDPLWAAAEFHNLARQLATQGWGFRRNIADPDGEPAPRRVAAGRAPQITGHDTVSTELACIVCREPHQITVHLNGRGVNDAIAVASRGYRCPACIGRTVHG